jgi:hypothetical protein
MSSCHERTPWVLRAGACSNDEKGRAMREDLVVTFSSITPLLPAGADMAEALALYTRHLGFAIEWQGDEMAGVRRGAVALNLVRNANRQWAENASVSIGVAGLDALYAEYRDVPARVGPIEVKPWGRREFHMILPSGVSLQFFEKSSGPQEPGEEGVGSG